MPVISNYRIKRYFIVYLYYSLFRFEVSTSSDEISSVISFLSVTVFFFTTTSSSSLLNGIFISSGDCTGSCAFVWLLGGLLSILSISSLINWTSTVLFSLTGFFVITVSSTTTLLVTSNSSDIKGITSVSSFVLLNESSSSSSSSLVEVAAVLVSVFISLSL